VLAFRSSGSAPGRVLTAIATAWPAGVQAGDVVVLGVLTEGADVAATIAAGSMTKLFALYNRSENWVGAVFGVVYDGVSSAPTVSWGGTSRYSSYVAAAYSGADPADPFQDVASTVQLVGSTTVVAPGVDTAVADELAVVIVFNDQGQDTLVGSSGMTQRVDIVEGAIFDAVVAASGPTGDWTLRQSGAVQYTVGTVALLPASGPPPGTTVHVHDGSRVVAAAVHVHDGTDVVPAEVTVAG
jgi:hypothetical protein